MRFIALIFALVLSGCAATSPVVVTPSPSPGVVVSPAVATAQRSVFAAKSTYAVAVTAAATYAQLPQCTVPARPPCSDAGIVTQLQKADNVAAASLDAAENAVRTLNLSDNARDNAVSAATAALAALQSLLPLIGGAL